MVWKGPTGCAFCGLPGGPVQEQATNRLLATVNPYCVPRRYRNEEFVQQGGCIG